MVCSNESIFIQDLLPQVLYFEIDFQNYKPDDAKIYFWMVCYNHTDNALRVIYHDRQMGPISTGNLLFVQLTVKVSDKQKSWKVSLS